ncbi:MAG: P-II family nitrogen regulator [Betaproteobacteria bacterium]|nr:P-II family nitrogen regulator [Betaproteobacteria bacterium]
MALSVVVAIIRPGVLEPVEKKLQEMGVRGITVARTKGYGEYANFFSRDWMVDQVRIEIFTEQDRAELIAAAILDAAHTGSPGDGIVAILPVEKVFDVRTRSEEIPNRFLG